MGGYWKDRFIRSITSLFENARRGRRKFTSYAQVYSVGGAIGQVRRNVFLLETVYRLDKDLHILEEKIEPKIPLAISPYTDLDLNSWRDKQSILEIRGEYGENQFRERFDQGDILFTAYSEGRLVGFVWLECPPVKGAGYPLENNEGYTYDGWTFSAYRGKHVFPALQQFIMDYVRLNRPDIHILITHVAVWNQPSLSGDQRAGYRVKRRELSIIFLGFHRKVYLRES